jgi:hypothetical protein
MVDRECPFHELMSEDLLAGAPLEDKCRLQPYQYGEFDQNTDYRECVASDHRTCRVYLEYKAKRNK